MSNPKQIPDDYMMNAAGHLVQKDLIKTIHLIEDDLVKEIVQQALDLQEQMIRFKEACIEKMESFADLAAQEYGTTRKGEKGNLCLKTYDGQYTVAIKVQNNLAFDSKLDVAKLLIDECIHEWSVTSRPEIKTLVEDAFQVNKHGNLNRDRIFGLLRLDITDPKWLKAMDALRDSIYHESSKTYFAVSRRADTDNKLSQLPMNLSSL